MNVTTQGRSLWSLRSSKDVGLQIVLHAISDNQQSKARNTVDRAIIRMTKNTDNCSFPATSVQILPIKDKRHSKQKPSLQGKLQPIETQLSARLLSSVFLHHHCHYHHQSRCQYRTSSRLPDSRVVESKAFVGWEPEAAKRRGLHASCPTESRTREVWV
jgi:hypothetical protein